MGKTSLGLKNKLINLIQYLNTMNTITKQSVIDFYLDWCNNWLTTSKMAEHYEMPKEDLEYLIELGRKYHKENFGPFCINTLFWECLELNLVIVFICIILHL